jgi:opacity protein-like surface antigen
MKISILLFVGCLLALLAPAAFAGEGGFYISLHGGGTLLEEIQNESDDGTFNFEAKEGWLAGGAIGYDLRNAYPDIGTGRVELEVTSRENDLDEVEFSDGDMAGNGTIRAESIMLNTIGEYRDRLPWIPYIGAGAGAARLTLDQLETAGTSLADDEDTVFAYQGLVGVGLQVACRFYLDLGYRYFAVYDPKFEDATGVEFDGEYASHNVTLGMRLDF